METVQFHKADNSVSFYTVAKCPNDPQIIFIGQKEQIRTRGAERGRKGR
jgi:hypothetical protein